MKLQSKEDINKYINILEWNWIQIQIQDIKSIIYIGKYEIIIYICKDFFNKKLIKHAIEIRYSNTESIVDFEEEVSFEEEPFNKFKCFNIFENSINPFSSLMKIKEILILLFFL